MKTQIIMKQIDEEITDFLLQMNYELYEAELIKDFVTCQTIKASLENFVDKESETLAGITNKPVEQMKVILTEQSNFLFNSIKNNYYKINHL
jgi:hypothetical protein